MLRVTTLLCVLAVYAQGTPISTRILGGKPIPINAAQYQVSIQHLGQHVCGGSIISRYHVLSAAHCIAVDDEKNLSIGSASNVLSKLEKHQVAQVTAHPSFNRYSLDYDVAVLRVSNSDPLSTIFGKRRPALIIGVGEELADNSTVFVSGWGGLKQLGTGTGIPPVENLSRASLNILNRKHCENYYTPVSGDVRVTPRMICAKQNVSEQGVTPGDDGGALMSQSNGRQVGIVSWAVYFEKEFPSVYTNLADKEIHDFITRVLKQYVTIIC